MRTAGIVAEYNPFHKGHKFHIEETRRKTGADCIAVVMSGNFVQRGEPAMFNKWLRAEAAVTGGADIVIELPTVYSCSGAEAFARGAVEILDRLGEVEVISFGAEEDSADLLEEAAEIFAGESTELSECIKQNLSEGYSYAAARSRAVEKICGRRISEVISSPNNILAVEYIKQLKLMNSSIKPLAVARKGSGYYEENPGEGFAGAGRLRDMLKEGYDTEEILKYIPEETHELYRDAHMCFSEDMYSLVAYKLLSESREALAKTDGVVEGLENRALKALPYSVDMESLIQGIKSKRYSRTSIQRMLVRILLGIKSVDMKNFGDCQTSYARVLAFNETGAKFIRQAKNKDNPGIKIITNVNREKPEDPVLRRMMEYDIMASEIYDLICFSRININPDYKMKPYRHEIGK
ncbi:MAG: nucleotidyltransferase [Bacillota bacterium]|nr:nucleotidyltransferase [Bacillota bacterium]